MAPKASIHQFSDLQDVLGSLQMIKRYTVICLCFCLKGEISPGRVEAALAEALQNLTRAFPFLAGRVHYDRRDETHTGIATIIPHKPTIQLIINDLAGNDVLPSMFEMRQAKYPFSMLDSTNLVPAIAISWATDGFDKVAPVLILQANIVKGGLLLTFSVNHATTDMTGLGQIISHFAKACRGEPFTDEEIQQGNQSRRNAVPLFSDDYKAGTELDDSFTKSEVAHTVDGPRSPPRWAYFNFSSQSLSHLKAEASNQTIVPYISTDDAVAAICWQRVTLSREQGLGKSVRTQLARPISVRNYLGLKGYLGYMVDVVYENEVDVWQRPLGEIAGRLRQALQDDAKIRHHIQAFATILNRLDDKRKLINGALLNPNRDVVVSSYANIRCCELSFGPLFGKPDAARRPRMPVWPSLLYVMPKSSDGDIAVALCLEDDALMRLREDPVFAGFAEYIG